MIRVERHPQGPRVWVAGQRLHHGATGAAVAAAALLARSRPALAVGLTLCVHDRADLRVWFKIGAQR